MVNCVNKEILDKVSEIIDFIKESKEYQNYIKAKELLSEDKELTSLIAKIKKYQKDIVNKKGNKEELETRIATCLNILNDSPLYNEYCNYQEEINNLLTIFENKINKYFYDVFN